MAKLRSPGGCAWDREQTHSSLRGYLIEETYEAVDAIDRGDFDELRGELGDILLQCVFHAQLATEAGRFTIADVIDGLTSKLIGRHPHVFRGDGRLLSPSARARQLAGSSAKVKEQWARIKSSEQARAGAQPRLLAGVPRALPALLRAHKIGSRAASVGFDWPAAEQILDKVHEELTELRAAMQDRTGRASEELGDLLFTVANLARKMGLDAERVMSEANDKFTRRFDRLEGLLGRRGQDVHHVTPEILEAAWSEVKAAERRRTPGGGAAQSTSTPAPSGRRSRSLSRRRDPS